MWKRVSDMFGWCARVGADWFALAGTPALGIQVCEVVSTGTPDTVVLANQTYQNRNLVDMADTDYIVMVCGETVARCMVDESTKAVTGFNILGGAAGEVMQVVVIGRLAGMQQPSRFS